MVPDRNQTRANPARGLALIATAVIIGLFLLRNWDGPASGSEIPSEATQGDKSTGSTGADDGGKAETPGKTTGTTAAAAARPPSEITVRVLNGTDVGGAAKRMSDILADDNYKTVKPDDAGTKSDATQILFAAGYEKEAQELAQAIASPPNGIVALADPPQFPTEGAQLVVVLGKDLAK
jgi:hypothetical protein